MRRETLIGNSQIRIGDTKKLNPDEWKGMVARYVHPLLYNCLVLVDFLLLCHQLRLKSLFLCTNANAGCVWFVVQNWRILPQNGNLLLRIEALHGVIILSLQIELIQRSVLIIHSDSWVVCLFISPLVPLGLLQKFLHSVIPPHYAFFISLLILMLSRIDTHYLNRHIVGCGCLEILIEHCITVLFLSNLSLYPIQLWFWGLSYSNRPFQLIGIQYSLHHSDLPRSRQTCYQ